MLGATESGQRDDAKLEEHGSHRRWSAADASPARRARILLVDDYPANLTALEAVLAPLGHDLVKCMSGEEALRRIVVEPARRAGLGVEDAVVDAVIDDAADQPQPLPMISVALVRAWEAAAGGPITLAAYRAG